jgi:hypothetical protein
MAIIGTGPFRITAKNQQLYKGSLICAWTGTFKIFPSKVSIRVTFKITGYLKWCTEWLNDIEIFWQRQVKDGDNWSSTSTLKFVISRTVSNGILFIYIYNM